MDEKYTVIICNSNMFIPITLTMVLSERNKKFLVISDTGNVKEFITSLDIDNVTYEHYVSPSGYKSIFVSPMHNIKHLFKYNVSSIYFFHHEYGGIINNYIKLMSRNVPIYYVKVYNKMTFPKANFGWSFIKSFTSLLLHNHFVCYDFLQSNKTIIPSLPESFFSKIKAKTVTCQPDSNIIGSYLKEKMSVSNNGCDILLLTGTAVTGDCQCTTEEFYTESINKLIDAVGEERIMAKCHPRFNMFYGKEKGLKRMPTSYPGNLFVGLFDCTIGVESTLLVEAAQAGKKAISLINYLEGVDNDLRKQIREFLLDRLAGRGTIYFPSTIDEITQIIS